jgi:anti-sigma factor RsiW
MNKDKRLVAFVRRDWVIVPVSLAIAFVAFIGGAIWGGRATSERSHLIDEIAEYHEIFSRETQHLVEVPAEQAAELTTWLTSYAGKAVVHGSTSAQKRLGALRPPSKTWKRF